MQCLGRVHCEQDDLYEATIKVVTPPIVIAFQREIHNHAEQNNRGNRDPEYGVHTPPPESSFSRNPARREAVPQLCSQTFRPSIALPTKRRPSALSALAAPICSRDPIQSPRLFTGLRRRTLTALTSSSARTMPTTTPAFTLALTFPTSRG